MFRNLELTRAWSLRIYPKKVVIFQKTWKIRGHVAEVPREMTRKRLGLAIPARKERLNRPVKGNSRPRIGQVWKVMTTGNPKKKIVLQPHDPRAVDEVGEI